MAKPMMAFPQLRHPFTTSALHPPGSTSVLYQGKTLTLSTTGADDELLIRAEDLTRINGFEVKAEGVCLGDLCIPLQDTFNVTLADQNWFNLIAFARFICQPFVADTQNRVCSFAEIPAKRESTLSAAMAPEFELTDRKGAVIRMTDFKGKKALIVTWSSW